MDCLQIDETSPSASPPTSAKSPDNAEDEPEVNVPVAITDIPIDVEETTATVDMFSIGNDLL